VLSNLTAYDLLRLCSPPGRHTHLFHSRYPRLKTTYTMTVNRTNVRDTLCLGRAAVSRPPVPPARGLSSPDSKTQSDIYSRGWHIVTTYRMRVTEKSKTEFLFLFRQGSWFSSIRVYANRVQGWRFFGKRSVGRTRARKNNATYSVHAVDHKRYIMYIANI